MSRETRVKAWELRRAKYGPTGNSTGPKPVKPPTPPYDPKAYILARIEPDPNSGCWLWTGPLDADGYGKSMPTRAHRRSWLAFRGPIAAGLMVLHKCDTRCCVNPDHLSLGTHDTNMIDMAVKGRSKRGRTSSHCQRGHEFSPENTYTTPNGERRCRTCMAAQPCRRTQATTPASLMSPAADPAMNP